MLEFVDVAVAELEPALDIFDVDFTLTFGGGGALRGLMLSLDGGGGGRDADDEDGVFWEDADDEDGVFWELAPLDAVLVAVLLIVAMDDDEG